MSGIVLTKEDRAKLLRPSKKEWSRAEIEALCETCSALESALVKLREKAWKYDSLANAIREVVSSPSFSAG